MSKRALMIGAVLVIVVVAAVTTAAAVVPRVWQRTITVTAHFQDAVGLYPGNAVSVLGMQVGKVDTVVNKGNYVEVTGTVLEVKAPPGSKADGTRELHVDVDSARCL